MINFKDLVLFTEGKMVSLHHESVVRHIITDSRKVIHAENSMFFAMVGMAHDGHEFIEAAFAAGCRNFVLEKLPNDEILASANVFQVENTLKALQDIAIQHRSKFKGKVIGVTGSNGKTIVKEWMYELLNSYTVSMKSPLSYNSQLGVPLSIWKIEDSHSYAILEAGISEVGEMSRLEAMIRPLIGVFTNIGSAHQEGFPDISTKIREKLELFKSSEFLIYCKDHQLIDEEISKSSLSAELVSWGVSTSAAIIVESKELFSGGVKIGLLWKRKKFSLNLPFQSEPHIENAMHCIALMMLAGYSEDQINTGLLELKPLGMRLHLLEGIQGSIILDDSYNNDLSGLIVAMEQLVIQRGAKRKILILSDVMQSGMGPTKLYTRISESVIKYDIDKVIGIGKAITAQAGLFAENSEFYSSTDEFLQSLSTLDVKGAAILIKGARSFGMERIVQALQQRVHGTVLEINLNSVTHNLNYYRSRLPKPVKIMAMIKALAYGSGSIEMARHLLHHGVDYLGVAYADEGVILREHGITAPIMVMNPQSEVFPKLIEFNLEAEVYSIQQLESLAEFSDGQTVYIHIKLETGMNRLGFQKEEIELLGSILSKYRNIRVKSIFSHLAGSEDPSHDEFSRNQAANFKVMVAQLAESVPNFTPIVHLLNSGGISRFPEYHFDMVRIGIGLYGYSPNAGDMAFLKGAHNFKSYISQIKTIEPGSTVGYGRKGEVINRMTVATVAVGYADGFSRQFSNGKGFLSIHDNLVPVVGNVCMDMTMVDITGLDAQEGDEVIIWGENPRLEQLAEGLETIPYEILSGISSRVKRIYTYS